MAVSPIDAPESVPPRNMGLSPVGSTLERQYQKLFDKENVH
jgi:hypothetical protein